MTRATFLLLAFAIVGCGGTTTSPGAEDGGRDATVGDGGADAEMCPPSTIIPDAAVYSCDAAAPGAKGCRARDPNDTNVYPLGCVVHLPQVQGGCGGPCCGPQECTCDSVPFGDAGAEFVCPL